jgi:hypothetical protein
VRFVTLERGPYGVGPGLADDELICRRVQPHRTPRVVAARHRQRLRLRPPRAAGTATNRRGRWCAGRARALDLLPALAFPLEEILPPRDLRQVQLLYGIGGLSYGNVSAALHRWRPARRFPTPGGPCYWMKRAASTEADLRVIGEHILDGAVTTA